MERRQHMQCTGARRAYDQGGPNLQPFFPVFVRSDRQPIGLHDLVGPFHELLGEAGERGAEPDDVLQLLQINNTKSIVHRFEKPGSVQGRATHLLWQARSWRVGGGAWCVHVPCCNGRANAPRPWPA